MWGSASTRLRERRRPGTFSVQEPSIDIVCVRAYPPKLNVAIMIEGLPVLSLAALIEAKIAYGEGDTRRMHRDFADVVELIAVHGLDGSFARHLHNVVRPRFRRLVRHVG